MSQVKFDVLGIGNAIVDVIATSDDAFLQAEGLTKGRMQLIDTDRAEELYARMNAGIEASGGSVANSMAGIASLGGKAAFIGKIADDELGKIYAHDMRAIGVHFQVAPADPAELPTGRSLILVTPDGERTMNTYLGAAGLLSTADIELHIIQAAKVVYLEGYRFDLPGTKAAFYRAAELAKEAGRKVAVSLSDKFCVEGHRQHFIDLINNYTDILFANETEIEALYQTDFDSAAELVRSQVEIACLTRSERGSRIVTLNDTIQIAPEKVEHVVDTTGAGDLYAAGFLYGYTRGLPLAECGRIGSLAAAEVISHYGPRPQVSLAELIAA